MKRNLLHIIFVTTLLIFPNVNFAQAPDLGAASSFALFTAVGAFTNVGSTTYVTGDVGTNGGAFAFPDGTIDGQIHVVDIVSDKAATDVGLAYTYLRDLTCGAVIGTSLGSGQELSPDVYCLGGASTLTGNLTLNGQGDPNALFIFQINGALSASTYSNVILSNSASWCNVYWQINGAFDLGDGSVFKGTIIAAGPISLYTGTTLDGRSLTTAGAISINETAATLSCSASTLPIELLYFVGSNKQFYNLLSWSTASEINNNYFTLESATDGENFSEVTRIAGAGNSNTALLYSAIDYNPNIGISYYRLTQTDFDGKRTYSNIVAIDFVSKPSDDFIIYPNPFGASATMTFNNALQINNVELRIYNVLGKEVMNTIISGQTTEIETSDLPSGIYSYKLVLNSEQGVPGNDITIQSGKLVSQQ